jgi:hypothetical protein
MRMRRPSPASPASRSRAPPRSPSRFTNGGIGVAAQTTSRHLGARQIRAIPEGEDGFWQRAGEYWWQGMNAGEDDARLTVTGKYIALDRNFAVIAKGDFAWSAAFKSSEKPATYAPRGRPACAFNGFFPAHRGIVTAISVGDFDMVGGNVDSAVVLTHIDATPDGRLSNSTFQWLVVLRVNYAEQEGLPNRRRAFGKPGPRRRHEPQQRNRVTPDKHIQHDKEPQRQWPKNDTIDPAHDQRLVAAAAQQRVLPEREETGASHQRLHCDGSERADMQPPPPGDSYEVPAAPCAEWDCDQPEDVEQDYADVQRKNGAGEFASEGDSHDGSSRQRRRDIEVYILCPFASLS